jgi:hypothetical protein
MATKAQVLKRVEYLGCTIECDGDEVTIFAPKGCTIDGVEYFTNVKSEGENTMADVWADCLEDLANGIEECA